MKKRLFLIRVFIAGCVTSGAFYEAVAQIPFAHITIDNAGPTAPWGKAIGDMNGDGRLDLIVGGNGAGGLVWYENPTWSKHIVASGVSFGTDEEVADVDGDGDKDIISITIGDIRWYENPSWTVHPIESRQLHDIEFADFDADGDLDLVARNQGEFGMHGNELHFYRQDSPTAWVHKSVVCPDGEGLLAVDVDGDADPDVIAGTSWFENTGNIVTGPWAQHVFSTTWTNKNTFVAAGDINGDSRRDIVLSPAELAGGAYHLSWFEAPINRSDVWTEHIVENNTETVRHFVGAADLNNDGSVDVVSAEMAQGADPDEVIVYVNGGTGLSWTKQVLATTGSHSMRIADIDNDGDLDLFGTNWNDATGKVDVWKNQTITTSVSPPDPDHPQSFALMQNYPNPFNPGTKVSFTLPVSSLVKLRVYDMLGRVVATLVNKKLEPGMHETTFDGGKFPSGIYFYRLEAGTFDKTQKMILAK